MNEEEVVGPGLGVFDKQTVKNYKPENYYAEDKVNDAEHLMMKKIADAKKEKERLENEALEAARIQAEKGLEAAREAIKAPLERMTNKYWSGLEDAKKEVGILMAEKGLSADEIVDVTDSILGGQHNADGFAWVGRGIGTIYSEPPKMGNTTPDDQRQIHLSPSNDSEYIKISQKHLGIRFSEEDGAPEIADFSKNGTAVIRNGETIGLSKIVRVSENGEPVDNPKTSEKWRKLQDGDVIVLSQDSGDQKVEIPIHIVAGHVVMEKANGTKLGKMSFGKKS